MLMFPLHVEYVQYVNADKQQAKLISTSQVESVWLPLFNITMLTHEITSENCNKQKSNIQINNIK